MVFDYARSLQISQEELDEWLNRINKINNKLSDYYYEQRLRKTLLVGSVGRGTAIIKTSDYDVIFVLPQEAYIRFDSYETNGQSALLQEVKGIISELYPRTEIKADGQVVDVFFDDGKIELVPVFKQPDGSFKFPDSHDGGKWKITKPVPEIDKATSLDNSSCAGCQWKYKPINPQMPYYSSVQPQTSTPPQEQPSAISEAAQTPSSARETVFCTQCGAAMNSRAMFCTKCGARLKNDPV